MPPRSRHSAPSATTRGGGGTSGATGWASNCYDRYTAAWSGRPGGRGSCRASSRGSAGLSPSRPATTTRKAPQPRAGGHRSMAEHDLQSVAFPALDEAQIARLGGCTGAVSRSFQDGQTLFATGERDPKFFVVKAGEVEIVDYSGDAPRQVVVHRPGEFTGDVSHLTGMPIPVSAIARGPCEVIQISPDALRRLLNQCPDLSDLLLQAFIARRQLLRQSPDFTGLRVIGSRYSADTFRVRAFLAKNRVLFTWVDVENDPQVDRLLKQFGVTEADTPVVACGHLLMLRNPSNRELADAVGIRQPLEQTVYDLAVVGAGPAGLAAAV